MFERLKKRLKNSDIVLKFREIVKQSFFGFYKNVYKTNYNKNVLVSYISYPIKKGLVKTHSNFLELQLILEIFKNLAFNIDVADYTYEGRIDYSKYDLIFGFGSPFGSALLDKTAKRALKICYLTGSLKLFNQMERVRYLRERKGISVIPRRNYYWKYLQESVSMSDAIILTGNEWTESTVRPYNSIIFRVRLPIFLPDKEEITKIIQEKDWERAKKNFLWFGSSGALHKGLDLCLDVFSNKENLYLHVCGPVDREEDFFEVYKRELTELRNIKYYSFVKVDSSIFRDIITSCAFAIFPSCSEGGGGSLLTCMAYGLIPIATIEASVDIEASYGILLEDYKVEYISEIVESVSHISSDKLVDMAIKSMEYTHQNHNSETYKEDFLNALRNLGVG